MAHTDRRCGIWLLMAVLSLAAALLGCNFSRYTGAPTARPAATLLDKPTAEEPAQMAPPAASRQAPALATATASAEPLKQTTPGGLTVLYTKDERLWVWRGGQARQIDTQGKVFQPRLSPDGRMAAFLRPPDSFHTELWVVDLEGSGERRLVSVADLDAIGSGVRDPNAVAIAPFAYQWLPGTHTLAFNAQQMFNGPGLSLLDDVSVVDADSGQIKNLLPAGQGGMFFYSPDAQRLAASKPDAVFLGKADGSDYRKVLDYAPVNTYSEYRYYAAPHWAADGSWLRLALPPADPLAQPAAPTTLWQLAPGQPPKQVGQILAAPFFEQAVVYSPDRSRIAYLRPVGSDKEAEREVLLAAYDGQGELVLGRGKTIQIFGWSPDNRRVAYRLGDSQEVWIGGPEEAPHNLAGAMAAVQDLRWVDEQRLLVIQQRGQSFALLLLDLQGQPAELDTFSEPPIYWEAHP